MAVERERGARTQRLDTARLSASAWTLRCLASLLVPRASYKGRYIGKLLSKGNIRLFKTSSASQHAVSANDGHYGLSFSH